jgi:hypothetical protein
LCVCLSLPSLSRLSTNIVSHFSVAIESETELTVLRREILQRDEAAKAEQLQRDEAAKAEQLERDKKLVESFKQFTLNARRSAAGSATNNEIWATSAASHSLKDLQSFFQPLNFEATVDVQLPSSLTVQFQKQQQEAHIGVIPYEVKMTQPTFMNAIAEAAGVNNLAAFTAEALEVPPCLSVELANGHVLRMFLGSQRWIRGRLSPDFGLFVKDYKATEFSCLLIGEADNKESVKLAGLTNDHKGENLLYQREVLERCPFRSQTNTCMYSFLTNNRQVQFLRSRVTSVHEDGSLTIVEEASQEVAMVIAWPYLWQLLNATPQQLGYSLPIVSINGVRIMLQSVVGVGAQGVCYEGVHDGATVLIKTGVRDEILQERRVIGALRTKKVDVAFATLEQDGGDEEGKHAELPVLCDGTYAIDDAAQLTIPVIVGYGPGVLVMSPIGRTFVDVDDGLCSKHIEQLLHLHSQLADKKVFHRDICPRHLLAHPGGGLLVIDWGFAVLPCDPVAKSRLSKQQQYASSDDEASGESVQIHSIVKSVYAVIHVGVVQRLRQVALTDVPGVWSKEFSNSSVAGRHWQKMLSGEGIAALPSFARGGGGGGYGGAVDGQVGGTVSGVTKCYGFRSENGKCLHVNKGL